MKSLIFYLQLFASYPIFICSDTFDKEIIIESFSVDTDNMVKFYCSEIEELLYNELDSIIDSDDWDDFSIGEVDLDGTNISQTLTCQNALTAKTNSSECGKYYRRLRLLKKELEEECKKQGVPVDKKFNLRQYRIDNWPKDVDQHIHRWNRTEIEKIRKKMNTFKFHPLVGKESELVISDKSELELEADRISNRDRANEILLTKFRAESGSEWALNIAWSQLIMDSIPEEFKDEKIKINAKTFNLYKYNTNTKLIESIRFKRYTQDILKTKYAAFIYYLRTQFIQRFKLIPEVNVNISNLKQKVLERFREDTGDAGATSVNWELFDISKLSKEFKWIVFNEKTFYDGRLCLIKVVRENLHFKKKEHSVSMEKKYDGPSSQDNPSRVSKMDAHLEEYRAKRESIANSLSDDPLIILKDYTNDYDFEWILIELSLLSKYNDRDLIISSRNFRTSYFNCSSPISDGDLQRILLQKYKDESGLDNAEIIDWNQIVREFLPQSLLDHYPNFNIESVKEKIAAGNLDFLNLIHFWRFSESKNNGNNLMQELDEPELKRRKI